ncbi:MAG: DinB family protein [Streptosporangiaceae bacterium]
MTSQPEDSEERALLEYLQAQRNVVLSIVAGLDEQAWQRPAVPTGWTPAGLVEHLGHAERHWFQGVVANARTELPWDDGRPAYDPYAAFLCDRPAAAVIGYYRDQCARSDAVLAVTPLTAPPRGRHGDPEMDEPPSVRWVVLHVIEETARHAGHLDIARELIDGQTGLGPR